MDKKREGKTPRELLLPNKQIIGTPKAEYSNIWEGQARVGVAMPRGQHIVLNERQQTDKYGGLRIDITKMWQLREANIMVVPVFIRLLDSIPPSPKKHPESINFLKKI